MGSLVKRLTVEDLVTIRNEAIAETEKFRQTEQNLDTIYDKIKGHSFLRIRSYENYNSDVQNVDKRFWRYLVNFFKLRDFMLSSDFEKLENEIETCKTPTFEIDNVISWVSGMKELITRGVKGLAESVYNDIINSSYYTSGQKKKRNNNGLDKFFILKTGDVNSNWYSRNSLTLTDDLEKLCYLLNGEKLPSQGIKELAVDGKGSCPYFRIKICNNGNTHYWLEPETVIMLNKIGSNSNIIGSDIKIKVF